MFCGPVWPFSRMPSAALMVGAVCAGAVVLNMADSVSIGSASSLPIAHAPYMVFPAPS